ncbi:hypothetical protein EV702DRAFT_1228417 [Suillus placidus]|uniref:Spp2/MOS2 G-patch domain-containing protein n=1 Tax=Suillus placidus TaxID=48579 RepID=A0A9P7D2G5_9AGAM|nr:hypothetical protein EV702DRAFT_1228417 [Suillus placidus]
MSKLSFTVRKPPAADNDRASDKFKLPALPRHLSSAASCASGTPLTGSPQESGIVFADGGRKDEPDSSDDEDSRLEDELITSFNKFGAQRVNGKKSQRPKPLLVRLSFLRSQILTDGRLHEDVVQALHGSSLTLRKQAQVPDGSVGGLGTRDTINSGPQISGIQFGNKEVQVDTSSTYQKALRALLAGDMDSAPQIDSIPVPPSETDALHQDVADLPDIDDYARMPITAFGAAMLRGMENALVEPYLPKSCPALLGIGAKEQEVLDDGSKKKKWRGYEKRYLPLVRQESSREESRNESAIVSRRASRSPERRSGGESREKVIAIGDENATVTTEKTQTEMTGGEEMIVEGTVTGTWTDGTEIAMSTNVVTVRDYDDRTRRRDGESKRGARD